MRPAIAPRRRICKEDIGLPDSHSVRGTRQMGVVRIEPTPRAGLLRIEERELEAAGELTRSHRALHACSGPLTFVLSKSHMVNAEISQTLEVLG